MRARNPLHRNVLARGSALDEYRIEEVLDVSGMAIDYLARDHNLEQQVVIKEYLPDGLAMRQGDAECGKSNNHIR